MHKRPDKNAKPNAGSIGKTIVNCKTVKVQ